MYLNSQFIFTKKKLFPDTNWKRTKINDYTIYSGPDLNVTQFENNNFIIVLLGDIFSYENTEYNNNDILKVASSSLTTTNELLGAFDSFCGSFLIFGYDKINGEFIIITDVSASRELFYMVSENELTAASQTIILGSVVSLTLDDSKSATEFFSSKEFDKKKSFVGDKTNYKGVKRLKPNYYLNVNNGDIKRFFPVEKLQKNNVEDIAIKASTMLREFISAANKRHKVAIPVSAGWESRIFLAASKDIKDDIFYYVIKHKNYSDNHQDIKTPKRMFKKLGLHINVLEYPSYLDNEELRIIKENISFPRENRFYYLFNVLNKLIPGYLILNGNVSEIARMQFDEIKFSNKYKIANAQEFPNSEYAMNYYDTWLNENKPIFERYNYRVSDMLYWEENCANWVSKGNSETRMVAERLQPFNSRELLKALLSVDKKFRRKQNPILHKKIIKHLWPECLSVPINPERKKIVIALMQKIGIYGIYRNIILNLKVFSAKNNLH